MTDEQEARIISALLEPIRDAMPWPFEDVDRDDLEAEETARTIAENAAVWIAGEFRKMKDELAFEASQASHETGA